MHTDHDNHQDKSALMNKCHAIRPSVPLPAYCHVDEITLAEHSWYLKMHASKRRFLYKIWTVTFSLPISLCRSFNNSKIYEVTVWVPAKLPNHYCSLSTLNSNFIVLTREQWKAILRAQWNKDSYYEQCCSPLFQHILIKYQAKPAVCLPHISA